MLTCLPEIRSRLNAVVNNCDVASWIVNSDLKNSIQDAYTTVDKDRDKATQRLQRFSEEPVQNMLEKLFKSEVPLDSDGHVPHDSKHQRLLWEAFTIYVSRAIQFTNDLMIVHELEQKRDPSTVRKLLDKPHHHSRSAVPARS